jgi:hypothetical protein
VELIESVINFLNTRLPDSEFSSLEPLRSLNKQISDTALRDCHTAIAVDLPLKEFACAYREAANILSLQGMQTRQLLPETLKIEHWKPLSVALSRIIASKPHSADVERLISSYNGLSSGLHAYLFIRHNMPPLAEWNPRPAVNMWINEKSRRPCQTHPQAIQQEYFKGIFN